MEFMKTCIVILYSIAVVYLSSHAKCSPPGPVVECSSGLTDCVVTNSYGAFPDRSICKAAQAVFPSTEEEILASVANAVKKQQKIRVVTRHSHSIPKLVCPEGDSGLIISSRDLNHVVSVDESSMTMSVESGMVLKDLVDSAAEHGLALPHSPYWLGVTVGGMLGTGAHGSSLFGKGSAVHEYVVGIRLVVPASEEEGYAKVVTLTQQDKDLNAAKVSLGILGVISQVTFQLEAMFKRSITNVDKNDFDIENTIVKFGLEHEFADLTWYPSHYKVVYRVDDRVSINSSGDGLNDFIGFQPQSTAILETTRATEEANEATSNGEGKCILSEIQVSTILSTGTGLKNTDILFTGYPVIGYQNKMQSAGSCLTSSENGLLTSCAWDPRIKGLFFHQTGMSISISKISEFISDVKKLRDMNSISMCGLELYSGIIMRFVKASSAYLGKQEDSVDMDITYYRSNDPNTPRLYEDVFEEIEQMGFFKYAALPHWGKNRNLAFDGVIKKYSKSYEFLSIKNKYDPQGIFSSEWTDSLLGLRDKQVTVLKDGCALEGLCVCSTDAHCAPDRGYFCEAGKVYTDARVCRGQEDKRF